MKGEFITQSNAALFLNHVHLKSDYNKNQMHLCYSAMDFHVGLHAQLKVTQRFL